MKETSFENSYVDDHIFRFCEDVHSLAKNYVDELLEERVSSEFSSEMVVYLALARYFRLLEIERESIRGIFTAEEFDLMLVCEDPPESKDQNNYNIFSVENQAYCEYIHNRYFCPEFEVVRDKIGKFNLRQQVIFGDVLECATRSSDPVAYAMNALG